MKPEIYKFGTGTWYSCPVCYTRLAFENGDLISGKKYKCCPCCGEELDWKEEVVQKKSGWRKFRQTICWIIGGRNQEKCKLTVKTAHPDEVICSGCEHNLWKKGGTVQDAPIK